MIPVVCACGAKFGAKPELRGKAVKCPKCGQALVVGAGAAAAAGAAPGPGAAGADFGLGDLLDEVGLKAKATGENACPGCGAFLAPEAVLCVQCGYDRKAKRKVGTQSVKKVEARKLGGPNAAAKGGGEAQKGGGGSAESTVPWEAAKGDFGALFSTVKGVLSAPEATFARMLPDGLRLSLGYFFTTVLLIAFILAFLVGGAIAALSGGNNLGAAGIVAAIILVYMLIASSISLLLNGAIYHGLLKMVGGANKPIRTTYQVIGYCSGAANVIALCPCVSFLAAIVAFYSIPFGMASAHQTSIGKTYIALLLFIVLGFAFQFALGTALEMVISQYLPETPQGY